MARVSFDPSGGLRGIRRIALAVTAVIALLVFFNFTMTRIDAGHVGIRVKLAGSARGVQDIPVVTGWVFYNPLTEQIISFPTSVQNVVWTKTPTEGRAVDESITFSSEEGVNVNADIGLSFHIDPVKAPHLYLRFRQPNLMILADGYVRNAVREAFNDVASRMAVQKIYGPEKGKLLSQVTRKVTDVLGKDGFVIDQLTINGALRLPPNVATAINKAMEATQNALQAQNKVAQVRAEADQAIAQARGQAEAARQRAEGDAAAVLIKARAEAKANEIIRLSTTSAVLQYRAVQRWNGKLPMFTQGNKLPMFTLDVGRLAMPESEREKRLSQLLEADQQEEKPAESSTAPVAQPPDAQASPATSAPPTPPAAPKAK